MVRAETSFQAGWDSDALLRDILCTEPDMEKLVSAPDVALGVDGPEAGWNSMESFGKIEIE